MSKVFVRGIGLYGHLTEWEMPGPTDWVVKRVHKFLEADLQREGKFISGQAEDKSGFDDGIFYDLKGVRNIYSIIVLWLQFLILTAQNLIMERLLRQ